MSKKAIAESLPIEAAKLLVGAIAGTLATVSWLVWQEAGGPVQATLESAASKPALLKLSLTLFLVNLFSWFVFWLMRSRPEVPLTMKFPFDEHGGHYIDPKTGAAICPKCLADGVIVHMMNVGGAKLCNACRCACRGPDTPKKPKP
jgi:hypothetical protein